MRESVADWLLADRLRLFGTATVSALVAMVVCLLLPHWFFSVVLAAVLAFATATLGLLSLATWWASREGATDRSSLWDVPDQGSDPEDIFRGFEGFREDHEDPAR